MNQPQPLLQGLGRAPRRNRASLEAALRATREVLEKRMSSGVLDGVAGHELRMALDAMDFLWEEVGALARLISRDRRRYARFFDHVPDAYLITTPQGRINEANRAAVGLFGVPDEKLPGQSLAAFLETQERSRFLERLALMTHDAVAPRPTPWLARLHPATGAPLKVALTLGAIEHSSGKVAELCWLIRPAANAAEFA